MQLSECRALQDVSVVVSCGDELAGSLGGKWCASSTIVWCRPGPRHLRSACAEPPTERLGSLCKGVGEPPGSEACCAQRVARGRRRDRVCAQLGLGVHLRVEIPGGACLEAHMVAVVFMPA